MMTLDTRLAWKVLATNGAAYHGGTGKWGLPEDGEPGGWKTVRGPLVPCGNGLHLCRHEDLVHWLGPAIFVAEYEGDPVVTADKIVVRRARLVSRVETWDDRTARLFAADCADRALRLAAKRGLTVDGRSKAAVKAARDFANGKIDGRELDAAGAAAGAAAWAAAGAAAGDAAWAAARAAAWAAAGDAAGDAERKWQTDRLHEYLDGKRGV